MNARASQSARQRAFFSARDGQNASLMPLAPRQSGIYRSALRQHRDVGASSFAASVVVTFLAGVGLLLGIASLLR
jgi:hypothetical protein